MVVTDGGQVKTEQSGGEYNSTSNRMELRAVIEGLKIAQQQRKERPENECLHLYSDSQYVVRGINQWAPRWSTDNWKKRDGRAVRNQGLWKEALRTLDEAKPIKVHWLRGHAGTKGNEHADRLATKARKELDEKGAPKELQITIFAARPEDISVSIPRKARDIGVNVNVVQKRKEDK